MKYDNIRRFIGISLFILISIQYSFGQREKNNIYLFDCTWSMKTNGLWAPAKAALDATITTQSAIPGSRFCVIPFGDTPHQSFEFDSSNHNDKKAEITKALDNYINQEKFTRISDVLEAGFKKVDANKENKIYLLTDGLPNGGDSPQKVARTITNWCGNHRNCRLFYVALKNDVINPEIQQAIDACPDAFIVQCKNKVIPQIADISSDVYTNLEELQSKREIPFSIPGRHDLRVESEDPMFDVIIDNKSARDGKIMISLSPKDGLDKGKIHQNLQGGAYEFSARLQCVDERYFIANPDITIHVTDEVPSKLTIAQGKDGMETDGISWYDSFLWSGAADEKSISWNLAPVFANEYPDSRLDLKFQSADEHTDDFHVWFNGQQISNGSTIRIQPGKPALLEVRFMHTASTGSRYFTLTPAASDGIDLINERPSEEYEGLSLRTEYSIGWNPLKTLLFWLAIIVLAALIVWLLILRRIFFPPIKVGKVSFAGPGSYYASKRIKGARKVILTSKRKSQNILSRIFTGEIRFVRAEHFSPELSIEPAPGKRKVIFRSEGKAVGVWEMYPSSTFGQDDNGKITNRVSKETTEVEFN